MDEYANDANGAELELNSLISKVETIDIRAKINQVLPLLEKYPALLVNKDGKYAGIIDSRSLYKSKVPLKFFKDQTIEKYVASVPAVSSNTNMDELLTYFYEYRTKSLPYMEKGEPTGIVERDTLLQLLLSRKLLSSIKIENVMSTPVIAIDADADLPQAKKVMEDHKVNRLLVVKNNKVVGLLTYYTLISKYSMINERHSGIRANGYVPPVKAKISEIIDTNPMVINYDDSVANAARRLIQNKISSLVVVNEKETPIGILTVSDIFEKVIAERRLEESRIFISGLDSSTKKYEPELREGLKALVSKFEKSRMQNIHYVQMHIKKVKSKQYDISIRVAIQNGSILTSSVTGFLLENTFEEALHRLRNDLIKMKEKTLTIKRSSFKGTD